MMPLHITEEGEKIIALKRRIDDLAHNCWVLKQAFHEMKALAACRSALSEAVRAMNVADQIASVVVNRWNERGAQ